MTVDVEEATVSRTVYDNVLVELAELRAKIAELDLNLAKEEHRRKNASAAALIAQEVMAREEKQLEEKDRKLAVFTARHEVQVAEIGRLHLDLEALKHDKKHLEQQLHDERLDSADLQMVCLALAELELRRPGFNHAIDEIAKRLGGTTAQHLIAQFKKTSVDLIQREILTMGQAPPPESK